MKKILITLVFIGLTGSLAFAEKFGDVDIPSTLAAGKQQLVLNGAGYRTKFFMKIYVGALYLSEKSSDQNAIINANKPMAIKMHIISGLISSAKMIKAVETGFENATGGNVAPIEKEKNQLLALFKEEIKVGDIYDLIYTPNEGVRALKNGKEKGLIKGLPFKKALFGIWLCDSPADKYLKRSMLGQ
ncbi:MAG: hypothetical protein OMM_01594 [Candidatus Magnetoglobus multicellularis str. Araruama]|uniref:Chalcone isomerase domain-containing protein n=1 Tax=Candidatus Magnetoglobus multicellularis str. Araruama TaxID=890399 RepID=A0A1V1PCU9_9BACT|nr:MAG: hypothetical protein OMM_01594 [Candidatus Magnetoglobus multicellularis str. Araruama]